MKEFKNLKTFEQFSIEYKMEEELNLKEFGRNVIDKTKKGLEKAFTVTQEEAEKIAKSRYSKHIESAKKFDSNPSNVEKAKKAQKEAKLEYKTAEESLYHAIRMNKDAAPAWDSNLGIFRSSKIASTSGIAGGKGMF
jgi:hypothetical protein